jgi:hypothetical protein
LLVQEEYSGRAGAEQLDARSNEAVQPVHDIAVIDQPFAQADEGFGQGLFAAACSDQTEAARGGGETIRDIHSQLSSKPELQHYQVFVEQLFT